MLRIGTGNYNIAVGHLAAEQLTSASQNVGVGYNCLNNLTTGGSNVAIGYNAGDEQITASENVWIGNSCVSTAAWAGTAIVGGIGIGSGLDVRNGSQIRMGRGGSYIYNNYTSSNTWGRISDERRKKEIQDSTVGLSYINDLRPVTYNWRAPNELPHDFEGYDADDTTPQSTEKQIGLIAQEVKAVNDAHSLDFNLAWEKPDGYEDINKNGVQAITYENLVMPLIKAVQELSAKNDALEARIETLEG